MTTLHDEYDRLERMIGITRCGDIETLAYAGGYLIAHDSQRFASAPDFDTAIAMTWMAMKNTGCCAAIEILPGLFVTGRHPDGFSPPADMDATRHAAAWQDFQARLARVTSAHGALLMHQRMSRTRGLSTASH